MANTNIYFLYPCKRILLVGLKVTVVQESCKFHPPTQTPVVSQYAGVLIAPELEFSHHFSKSSAVSFAWARTSLSTSLGSWWNSNLSSSPIFLHGGPDISSANCAACRIRICARRRRNEIRKYPEVSGRCVSFVPIKSVLFWRASSAQPRSYSQLNCVRRASTTFNANRRPRFWPQYNESERKYGWRKAEDETCQQEAQ